MPDCPTLPPPLSAALDDAEEAVFEYEGACSWFKARVSNYVAPLAVEVWVFDRSRQMILLVEHRWRGWVPPGGKAEPGELPRTAAARELVEESGIVAELLPRPAAATVRSYHPDWPLALGLTYAAIVDSTTPLTSENGQPTAWRRLDRPWTSSFPADRERITAYRALRL